MTGGSDPKPERGPATARWAALVGLAFLATPLPASAGAQTATIGANLNRPVTANYGCEIRPPFGFPGANSCTWLGTPAPPINNQSTAAPANGVITRVRVKTRAPTGPMRVTVLRQLGDTQSGLACCFFQGESQVFTPAVNGNNDTVTQVNVRLPVENGIDINAGQRWLDYLAISVLAPGVRIPAFDNGTGDGPEFSGVYYPHVTPADATSGRVDNNGTGGVLPLMNADFIALCGGNAAGFPKENRRARAEASMGRCLGGVSFRGGRLGNSAVVIPIDCNIGAGCRGTVILLGGRGAQAAAKLGAAKFRAKAGKRKKVKVKLTKAGKRAVRGKRKLTLRAKAKIKGGPNESGKVKLKR